MSGDKIITNAAGVVYRRREFVDSLGRRRVRDKRLDAIPKPHAETCGWCGAPITAERSTRRFCGDACRIRAYRSRKKAR